MSNNFFNDFLNELTTANLQAQGDMSIIEFANRIIFNNDEDFQLYPTQKAILKSFYGEQLTDEEEKILSSWVDEDRSTWVKDRRYISLVLEAGRRASKCNASSARIPTTVGDITYGELYTRLSQKEKIGIITYDIDGKLPLQYITYDIKAELNKYEKVYKLSTASGKCEITNENHPFLVWRSSKFQWIKLKDLKPGMAIAVSKSLPIFGTKTLSDDFLKVAAALITLKVTKDPDTFLTSLFKRDIVVILKSYFKPRDFECDENHRVKINKSKIESFFKVFSKDVLCCLDKESLRTFLRYVLQFSSYSYTYNNGDIFPEEKYSYFDFTVNRYEDQIVRSFIKFGVDFSEAIDTSYYSGSLNRTSTFLNLFEEFGWDLRYTEEYNRRLYASCIKGLRYWTDKNLPEASNATMGCYDDADDGIKTTTAVLQNYAAKNDLPYWYEIGSSSINWERVYKIEEYGMEQTIALEVADTHVIGSYIISHNSTMASIIALKEFYDLIIMENPHKYYGMLTGSPIAILVMAQSQAQVKETIFAAIKGYAENSHFFSSLQKRGDIEILSEEIRCPRKNVAIYAKHTNSKSLVGYNLKCMLLDEVARFETTGEEGKNKAFEIWRNVAAGGAGFGSAFKKVAISSAWEPGDPIEVLFEDAKKDPNTLGFKLTTFQVNLKLIKGVTQVIVSDYTTDYVKARREYEGIRFSKFNAFIDLLNLQKAATGISCVDAQPCEIDVESAAGTRYYAGVDIIRLATNPNPDNLSFIHVDPALKKDSAALAIARPQKVEDKWKIQIDGLLKWEPHTDKKGLKRIVSYIDIEERLDDLCPARSVSRVTFDQWNCCKINSLIQTPSGLIEVQNLKKGDLVIGKNSVVNEVVCVEKKDNVPTIKITTKNGYILEATLNHPILNKIDSFQELRSLNIGDKVKLNIPLVETVDKNPETKEEHEALILGYLIAEGDWSKNYISFSNSEEETIDDYKTSFAEVLKIEPHIYSRTFANPKYKIAKKVVLGNKNYYNRLTKDLNLQTGSYNKKVPDYIFTATKKEIGLLISGLFEGDGTVQVREYTLTKKGTSYLKKSPRLFVELNTVSEKLSIQIQQLLLYLGIKSNRKKYYRKTPAGANTFYYRLIVSGHNLIHFKAAIGFRSTRKINALDKAISLLSYSRKSIVNTPEEKIVSVEQTISSIMHMEVSGDHTYCSEFINHNSASFIQKLHAKGIDAQQVPCSREAQFAYYTLFRDLLAHDYIILPRDSLWTNNAITELSELVLKPNRQIIHPYAGKDVADAIVNAVYQCHQYMVRVGLNISAGLNTGIASSQRLASVTRLNMAGNKLQIGSAIDKLYNRNI